MTTPLTSSASDKMNLRPSASTERTAFVHHRLLTIGYRGTERWRSPTLVTIPGLYARIGCTPGRSLFIAAIVRVIVRTIIREFPRRHPSTGGRSIHFLPCPLETVRFLAWPAKTASRCGFSTQSLPPTFRARNLSCRCRRADKSANMADPGMHLSSSDPSKECTNVHPGKWHLARNCSRPKLGRNCNAKTDIAGPAVITDFLRAIRGLFE